MRAKAGKLFSRDRVSSPVLRKPDGEYFAPSGSHIRVIKLAACFLSANCRPEVISNLCACMSGLICC